MRELVSLIYFLGNIYAFILLARVLISWVQVDPYHPAVQVLYQITEPVLQPIRQVLPAGSGLDFSPLIAMVLVQVITQILVSILA